MKGIVFVEFLEMVEESFGDVIADQIITESDLPSNGVYTRIGTYPFSELLTLVVALHKKTELPIPDLLKAFGHYLFGTFLRQYPQFFERPTNAFEFFHSIENYIHVEVRKLYPDAELPTFKTKELDSGSFEMIYTSSRKLYPFALGLIEKTLEYYKEDCTIEQTLIKEDGSEVKFVMTPV